MTRDLQAREAKQRKKAIFFYKVGKSATDYESSWTNSVAANYRLYNLVDFTWLLSPARHHAAGTLLNAGSVLWVGCKLEGNDHVHAPHRSWGQKSADRHHDAGSTLGHVPGVTAILGRRLHRLL